MKENRTRNNGKSKSIKKGEILKQKFLESGTLHNDWRPDDIGKALGTSGGGLEKVKVMKTVLQKKR